MIIYIHNNYCKIKCGNCKEEFQKNYSDLKIGEYVEGAYQDNMNVIAVDCPNCPSRIFIFCWQENLRLDNMAVAEVFNRVKDVGTIDTHFTKTQVENFLSSIEKLSSWKTLPFDLTGQIGKIYYDVAIKYYGTEKLKEWANMGIRFYGTKEEVLQIYNALGIDNRRKDILMKMY